MQTLGESVIPPSFLRRVLYDRYQEHRIERSSPRRVPEPFRGGRGSFASGYRISNLLIMSLIFRNAIPIDAERIAALVNSAYRGEHSRLGWTTEADLLDGRRTDAREVRRLIARRNSIILICQDGREIVGSVHIERTGDHASLGMFVVEPACQGCGLGKRLLARAEQVVQREWQVEKIVIHVITLRHELIAFYLRCGYRRTGVLHEFPVNPKMWQPKASGLTLEALEKNCRASLP